MHVKSLACCRTHSKWLESWSRKSTSLLQGHKAVSWKSQQWNSQTYWWHQIPCSHHKHPVQVNLPKASPCRLSSLACWDLRISSRTCHVSSMLFSHLPGRKAPFPLQLFCPHYSSLFIQLSFTLLTNGFLKLSSAGYDSLYQTSLSAAHLWSRHGRESPGCLPPIQCKS